MSKTQLWTGRVLTGLVAIALFADGFFKVVLNPHVVEASGQLGFTGGSVQAIGAILIACVVLYLVPATAPLGAVLMTGYLGGAVAINLRQGTPLFSYQLVPVYVGAVAWAGLLLRRPALLNSACAAP